MSASPGFDSRPMHDTQLIRAYSFCASRLAFWMLWTRQGQSRLDGALRNSDRLGLWMETKMVTVAGLGTLLFRYHWDMSFVDAHAWTRNMYKRVLMFEIRSSRGGQVLYTL